jgi:hypothetical protein
MIPNSILSIFAALWLLSIPLVPPAHGADDMAAPATLTARAPEIWQTLERAAWIAERGAGVKPSGKILYAVTFRSCPTCAAFKAAEHDAILAAGTEVRWIMYARRDRDGKARSKPGERAMIAALWLERDANLMNRWWQADDLDAFYNRADLPPPADGDPRREGALAQSRAVVDRLSGLLEDNAVDMAIPALFWREGSQTKAYIGYTQAGFGPARAYLTAPAN